MVRPFCAGALADPAQAGAARARGRRGCGPALGVVLPQMTCFSSISVRAEAGLEVSPGVRPISSAKAGCRSAAFSRRRKDDAPVSRRTAGPALAQRASRRSRAWTGRCLPQQDDEAAIGQRRAAPFMDAAVHPRSRRRAGAASRAPRWPWPALGRAVAQHAAIGELADDLLQRLAARLAGGPDAEQRGHRAVDLVEPAARREHHQRHRQGLEHRVEAQRAARVHEGGSRRACQASSPVASTPTASV
jgi:hypothetical protein